MGTDLYSVCSLDMGHTCECWIVSREKLSQSYVTVVWALLALYNTNSLSPDLPSLFVLSLTKTLKEKG